MILIYTKLDGSDVLVHMGGAPATSLGMGHSKMNRRFIEAFVRDTHVKGEGNIQSAVLQILRQFTDAYIERFAPKKLTSLRELMESAEGDGDHEFELAAGIGRVILVVRKWADEDAPAGVRIEYETGSGNRGVTWEYTTEGHVLDAREAIHQLRIAFREGRFQGTRFITEQDMRAYAHRIAVDYLRDVITDL